MCPKIKLQFKKVSKEKTTVNMAKHRHHPMGWCVSRARRHRKCSFLSLIQQGPSSTSVHENADVQRAWTSGCESAAPSVLVLWPHAEASFPSVSLFLKPSDFGCTTVSQASRCPEDFLVVMIISFDFSNKSLLLYLYLYVLMIYRLCLSEQP